MINNFSVINIYESPNLDSKLSSQMLYGEKFRVLSKKKNWLKTNISKAINLFIKNLKSFKKDISSKNNRSILKKLTQTKKVRSKIIKLKQDINKPNFGRD